MQFGFGQWFHELTELTLGVALSSKFKDTVKLLDAICTLHLGDRGDDPETEPSNVHPP
jgi:hypothetical protein